MNPMGLIRNLTEFEQKLEEAERFRRSMNRPFVVVSYAQSLDGSIASKERRQIALSGHESLVLTHRIRSLCEAILVGIETVLADDPELSVRLVEGDHPQPVVLDTQLRIPLTAKLLQRKDKGSWIVSAENNSNLRIEELERAGATVLPCAVDGEGMIELHALMDLLSKRKINSVMVEGGARVITSFINQELVDVFIVTISPKFVGGLQVIDPSGLRFTSYLQLSDASYQKLGEDIVLWACPVW